MRTEKEIPTNPIEFLKSFNTTLTDKEYFDKYSFLLGLYFGDGCIAKQPRTKRLTFALDKKYENLNNYVRNTLTTLFNKHLYDYDRSKSKSETSFRSNSIALGIYEKNIGVIFPHEGRGAKHLRKIELQEWQKEIINPIEIIKGLIYSDGCYFYCNTYKKFGFNFSNASKDIIDITKEYLEQLGIIYNWHQKKTMSEKSTCLKYSVSITRKKEVEKLHDLIGDKVNIK